MRDAFGRKGRGEGPEEFMVAVMAVSGITVVIITASTPTTTTVIIIIINTFVCYEKYKAYTVSACEKFAI